MSVDFIDSNVFVYLFDNADDRRRTIAESLLTHAHTGGAIISFQVVQETLAVLTRKMRPPMSRVDAQAVLDRVLRPIWHVNPSPALYEKALEVQERQAFSFYDSLIVAAALESGCRRLLSEDMQHGQRIGNLRIENPFAV